MEEKYLTINDVARMMNVTRATVHFWLRKGKLKGFRLSGPHGNWRFRESDIQDMVSSGSMLGENKKAGS